MPSFDVALLTDRRYTADVAEEGDWYLANILHDDRLLGETLAARGLTFRRVAWDDPTLDLNRFRCAVFRTTWDYFERFHEFRDWFERNASATRWFNPLETVRWNLDKHYLHDLERRGATIVPTAYLESGDEVTLAEALESNGWREAIVKPCISGGAWQTYRVRPENAVEIDRLIAPIRSDQAFLVQPFVPSIQTEGEITIVGIRGQATHAVRKRAKAGDFRVQDDHGGTVHQHDATPEEVAFAERVFAACDECPLYGRVDLVRLDDGSLAVMELELVEPELWLRFHPPAAAAFGNALADALVD